METNSFSQQYNWQDYNLSDVIGGKATDGALYLELFLKDYTKIFHEQVNASCPKCISTYLNNYKTKFNIMENNSKYQLKEKYNLVALEFGSQTMVTNANITDELAKKLIKRFEKENEDFKVSDLFDVYPIKEIKVKEEKKDLIVLDPIEVVESVEAVEVVFPVEEIKVKEAVEVKTIIKK